MITLLAKTENYKVQVEDVVDEPTGEEVCFVHIDMYKMGKGVLKELKQMLSVSKAKTRLILANNSKE